MSGRDRQCRVCLPLVNISRQHARITLVGEEYRLDDLESTNGTFVNGERIMRCHAIPGDRIKVGRVELVVGRTD